MKVLQILPELQAGGVERGTLEIARALIEADHEAIVISNGGELVQDLVALGASHITLPVHRKRLISLSLIATLRRIFESESPDIVHIRSRMPAWLAWCALRQIPPSRRPALVSTVHGFYSVSLYSQVMTYGDEVIYVSESVRQYTQRAYPSYNPATATTIHRGVDTETYSSGYRPSTTWLSTWHTQYPGIEDRYTLLLPGRITRWKGQLDFLQIIASLQERGIPAVGIIVGSVHPKKVSFQGEIDKTIESLGIEQSIFQLGNRSDLRDIMSVCDVTLSLSNEPEAFGRVSLEALSLGKPVLGYSHGGVEEQLTELFPEGRIYPGDIEGAIERLVLWFRTSPKPKTNRNFTLSKMVDETLKIYTTITENRNVYRAAIV